MRPLVRRRSPTVGAMSHWPCKNLLRDQDRLPVRVVVTMRPSLEELKKSTYVTGQGDDWVKLGAFKAGGDGGINAGTSFMREPWGRTPPSCSA